MRSVVRYAPVGVRLLWHLEVDFSGEYSLLSAICLTRRSYRRLSP